MSELVQDRLRDFTRRLLTRRGAEVEWPDGAAEGLAVVPPETAAALKCLDILPLSFRPDGALPVNLATDFLERVAPLVAAEPQIAFFRVPDLYLKMSDMADPVARAFTWLNARVLVRQSKPLRTEYHAWFFRAAMDSADRWEDVVGVTLNAASGAAVDLGDPMEIQAAGDEDAGQEDAEESKDAAPAPDTYRRAVRVALRAVETRAGSFVSRLESQLDRDRKRLRGYYHALLRERKGRSAAPDPEDPQAKDQAKRQAVELELRRKLAELDERYAIQADLEPLALIRIAAPVLGVECDVFRRKASRRHTLYWNALTKRLEPMGCHACGAATFAVAFTDEDVRPLCGRCAKC